jgi:hypothetical protein
MEGPMKANHSQESTARNNHEHMNSIRVPRVAEARISKKYAAGLALELKTRGIEYIIGKTRTPGRLSAGQTRFDPITGRKSICSIEFK